MVAITLAVSRAVPGIFPGIIPSTKVFRIFVPWVGFLVSKIQGVAAGELYLKARTLQTRSIQCPSKATIFQRVADQKIFCRYKGGGDVTSLFYTSNDPQSLGW